MFAGKGRRQRIRDGATQATEPEHVLLVHREWFLETVVQDLGDRVHMRGTSQEAKEHGAEDHAKVIPAGEREQRESKVCMYAHTMAQKESVEKVSSARAERDEDALRKTMVSVRWASELKMREQLEVQTRGQQ